jgi:hypothetical protein
MFLPFGNLSVPSKLLETTGAGVLQTASQAHRSERFYGLRTTRQKSGLMRDRGS